MLATQQTNQFQSSLINWFHSVGKDYPWRQTSDPWHILVSEVMLQQTQVATVLGKGFYTRFLQRYPTPKSISNAPEQEILSAWEGLGYYRRVRNLQKAAQSICSNHQGVFPTEHSEILNLPGIGQYTAGAVASFAYNQSQPIVDANVSRVFSRLFDYQQRVDSSVGSKKIWQWASELVSPSHPRIYNSALMELGQQICTNKLPKCDICPVQNYCKTSDPTSLPLKKARKKSILVDEFCMFAIDSDKQSILLHRAETNARRSGMWQLPQREAQDLEIQPLLLKQKYAITHHKVTLYVHLAPQQIELLENESWKPLKSLENLPMPSPFRRAINTLMKDYIG